MMAADTQPGRPLRGRMERSGRVANRQVQIETLVRLLMEPVGRAARRQAAEAIGEADRTQRLNSTVSI